jgi:hypothetical protein
LAYFQLVPCHNSPALSATRIGPAKRNDADKRSLQNAIAATSPAGNPANPDLLNPLAVKINDSGHLMDKMPEVGVFLTNLTFLGIFASLRLRVNLHVLLPETLLPVPL